MTTDVEAVLQRARTFLAEQQVNRTELSFKRIRDDAYEQTAAILSVDHGLGMRTKSASVEILSFDA